MTKKKSTLDIDIILSEIERVKGLLPLNPYPTDEYKYRSFGWRDACDTLAETLKKLASGHRLKGPMSEEEYNKRYKELGDKYRDDVDELLRKYVRSNCPVKLGQIVEDENTRIRVDKIQVCVINKEPKCLLTGPQVGKNNKPVGKKPIMGTIWSDSVIVNH